MAFWHQLFRVQSGIDFHYYLWQMLQKPAQPWGTKLESSAWKIPILNFPPFTGLFPGCFPTRKLRSALFHVPTRALPTFPLQAALPCPSTVPQQLPPWPGRKSDGSLLPLLLVLIKAVSPGGWELQAALQTEGMGYSAPSISVTPNLFSWEQGKPQGPVLGHEHLLRDLSPTLSAPSGPRK